MGWPPSHAGRASALFLCQFVVPNGCLRETSESRSALATAIQRVERVLEWVSELPISPVAGKILQLARDERIVLTKLPLRRRA
jgi:hypothetical protein